jgi:hypothetical protein
LSLGVVFSSAIFNEKVKPGVVFPKKNNEDNIGTAPVGDR